MNVKGAIFDMDGTLIDSLPVWKILWQKVGEKYLNDKSFYPSHEDDKAVRTSTLEVGMELIHKRYNIAKNGEELSNFTRDIFKWYYEEICPLKDGVIEFLEYLKSKGVKMCIASASSGGFVKLCMQKFNIEKYFIKIVSCNDIGKGKEFPDVFFKAQEVLGTNLSETFVIEDSLVALTTAKNAGFKTIGVYDENNYGYEEIENLADYIVKKGESFKKFIK